MKTTQLLVAVVLVFGHSCGLHADDEVATFASFPKGDELHLKFNSQGCFHDFTYELTFRRTDSVTVVVDRVDKEWSSEQERFVRIGVHRLGEGKLTDEAIAGLDRLVLFYRSKPELCCTTIDDIDLSQQRGGRIIAKEHFVDGSCSSRDKVDLTLIPTVIAYVSKPGGSQKSD